MENSFTHNLINMGGGIMSPGPQSTMCKAFETAVKAFCDDEGKRNGRFNDYYDRALKGTHPPEGLMLSEQMKRETAHFAHRDSPTLSLRDLYHKAKKEGADADLLERLRGAIRDDSKFRSFMGDGRMKSWDGFRNAMNKSIIGEHGLLGCKLRYPDGMVNGYPVELKGPGDEWDKNISPWSGRDQKGDYQQIRPDGAVIEVSCESCNHPCKNGNKCP
jgi:hypothetical protein